MWMINTPSYMMGRYTDENRWIGVVNEPEESIYKELSSFSIHVLKPFSSQRVLLRCTILSGLLHKVIA